MRRRCACRAHRGERRPGGRVRRREPRAGGVCRMDRSALGAPPPARGSVGMNVRRMFVFLHDVVAAGVAWSAAFWLRFNLDIPPEHIDMLVSRLPWVIAVYTVV